jgi:hypothetical protein
MQKKYALPAGKDYSDGYAALLSKLILMSSEGLLYAKTSPLFAIISHEKNNPFF